MNQNEDGLKNDEDSSAGKHESPEENFVFRIGKVEYHAKQIANDNTEDVRKLSESSKAARNGVRRKLVDIDGYYSQIHANKHS